MALIKTNARGQSSNLGRRNLIINGAMQVAQRGTSATVGPNGTGEGYTVVDRIRNSLNGSVVSTFTQSTDAPSGFGNSAKIEITTADSSLGSTEFWNFRYSSEGQDLQSIAKGTPDAKKITISFYVKSNKTGTYTVELEDTDNSRLNSLAYTVNNASTWERKTLTFNADTTGKFTNDNNLSLRINFWLCSGSQYQGGTFYNGTWGGDVDSKRVHGSQVNLGDTVGNTWQITGVQLEVGDTATDFEHRSFGEELALCQRYCHVLTREGSGANQNMGIGYWASSTVAETYTKFPTTMRSSPTASASPITQFYALIPQQAWNAASSVGLNEAGTDGCKLAWTVASNGSFGTNGRRGTHVGARGDDAKLVFDSEL